MVGIAAWTRNGAQNVNFATPTTEALRLNTVRPVTRWKEAKKKPLLSSSDGKRRSSPVNESAQSAQELKAVFQKAAGKEVTVTVTQDGQQEKFTFTVPPDFVK